MRRCGFFCRPSTIHFQRPSCTASHHDRYYDTSLKTLSLLDLPVEIITVIVDMCARQDQAFEHRRTETMRNSLDNAETGAILLRQSRDGYGRTANTLFKTCKVLKKLSMSHVFQTLKASQIVNSEVYPFCIAPHYLPLFRHLVFDATSKGDLVNLVASLHNFTSLEEVTLDESSANVVLGAPGIFSSGLTDLVGNKWLNVAARFRIMHLRDFPLRFAAKILKTSPLVSDLHFVGQESSIATWDVDDFVTALPLLEHLHLESTQYPEDTLTTTALLKSTRQWPPLKRLTLTLPRFDDEVLQFLKRFRTSLEHLKLVMNDLDDDQYTESWLVDGDCFPFLRSITIDGSASLAERVLRPATKANFPQLRDVKLQYGLDIGNNTFGPSDPLLPVLATEHNLHSLHYTSCDRKLSRAGTTFLRNLARERKFRLELRGYPEAKFPVEVYINPFASAAKTMEDFVGGADQQEEQEELAASFGRLGEHLRRTAEKAIETKNVPAMRRLAVSLRHLEFDRLAQLD